MKTIWTVVAVVLVYGTTLFLVDQRRSTETSAIDSEVIASRQQSREKLVVRASGRIKGRSEEIELRARINEQITEVHVIKGQWVTKGTVLVGLDPMPFSHERDLAEALLDVELAKKDRLVNGFRQSERETYRSEYEAALTRLGRAEKSHVRGVQLMQNQAISQQAYDELAAELEALRALAAAAKGRLDTVQLPAREDELVAASGTVRAAQSRLKMAELNLEHTQITAPVDGQILSIEAEVGELAGPQSSDPLIVIADTKHLRVVAEIDEFDALKVQLGQQCEIHSDATEGILAKGHVTEVEPQMHPKRLFSQWAGERTDTSALRVWIDLHDPPALPVGLPVDVFIHTE